MATPPNKPDRAPIIAGRRVPGWRQVTNDQPAFPKANKVPPAKPGTPTEGVTVKPRTPPAKPPAPLIAGKRAGGWGYAKPTTSIEDAGPTVQIRSSGSSGTAGKLGGQHMGGHSDAGEGANQSTAINMGGFILKTPRAPKLK